MSALPSTATLAPQTTVRLTIEVGGFLASAEAVARKVYENLASATSAHPASQPTNVISGGLFRPSTFVIDVRVGTKAVTLPDLKQQVASLAPFNAALTVTNAEQISGGAVSDAAGRDKAAQDAADKASEGSAYAQFIAALKKIRTVLVLVLIVGTIAYTWPYWRQLLPKRKAAAA